eukprot:scaffold13576_cov19-Tisochrysis_lutea.AAC.1
MQYGKAICPERQGPTTQTKRKSKHRRLLQQVGPQYGTYDTTTSCGYTQKKNCLTVSSQLWEYIKQCAEGLVTSYVGKRKKKEESCYRLLVFINDVLKGWHPLLQLHSKACAKYGRSQAPVMSKRMGYPPYTGACWFQAKAW